MTVIGPWSQKNSGSRPTLPHPYEQKTTETKALKKGATGRSLWDGCTYWRLIFYFVLFPCRRYENKISDYKEEYWRASRNTCSGGNECFYYSCSVAIKTPLFLPLYLCLLYLLLSLLPACISVPLTHCFLHMAGGVGGGDDGCDDGDF